MSIRLPLRFKTLMTFTAVGVAVLTTLTWMPAHASNHREAPFITTQLKVDGTDLYLFNSYEVGREGYVTVLTNYQPLQDSYGGPNYFKMDPNALYEIHIDNNGDAKKDLTFQFRFQNNFRGITLPIGGQNVAIPLTQADQVNAPNSAALHVNEKFTLTLMRGDRQTGQAAAVSRVGTGATSFKANIGTKTILDYPGYANQHIHPINIPGCATPRRVCVGQRQDGFAVNLGVIFDLVNAPVAVIPDPSLINAVPNTILDKNITTLALEIHKSCLLAAGSNDPVIGAWTTASIRQSQLVNANPPSGHQTTVSHGGA